MKLHAEFTTEPFHGEGEPPAHAVAARDHLRDSGLAPDFGPLGTAISGDREQVLAALATVLDTAFDAGARRITLQVSVAEEDSDPG